MASKKAKMSKRIKKRQEKNKQFHQKMTESQQKVLARSQKNIAKSGGTIGGIHSSSEKMSEIIAEYAAPLLESAAGQKEKKLAVSLAILCWNLALLPEEERRDFNKEMGPTKEMRKLLKGDGKNIINYMIEHKRRLFPDNYRFITDYDMFDTAKGFHLTVASLPFGDESEKS